MKVCSICSILKDDTEYGLYSDNGRTRQKAHCKSCFKEICRKARIKYRDKYAEQTKIYRQKHKERYRAQVKKSYEKNRTTNIRRTAIYRSTWRGKINEWKFGARRRKIAWELTDSFLMSLPLICHYTGESLTLDIGQLNTVSLDRVNSDLPYIESNVVFCCTIVNSMKMRLPKDIFIKTCIKIASYNQEKCDSVDQATI